MGSLAVTGPIWMHLPICDFNASRRNATKSWSLWTSPPR